MKPKVDYIDVTIANGASLSGAADLGTYILCGLIPDSAWDTNDITFQVSYDNSNWYDLYKEGTEYTLSGAVAQDWQGVDVELFLAVPYVKVRSGTTGSAVNQSGDTVITLITRPI